MFLLNINIRVYAAAIVNRPPIFGFKLMDERVGNFYNAPVVFTMRIIQSLYATPRRHVIFGNGNLHQAVIGQGKGLLYQTLAITALAYDDRAVEILQRTCYNFGRRSRMAVYQYHQWQVGRKRRSHGAVRKV